MYEAVGEYQEAILRAMVLSEVEEKRYYVVIRGNHSRFTDKLGELAPGEIIDSSYLFGEKDEEIIM